MAFSLENCHLPKRLAIKDRHQDASEGSCYIPKPKGEFNRPSNGYTLERMCKDTLGWSDDQWSQVEVSCGRITFVN